MSVIVRTVNLSKAFGQGSVSVQALDKVNLAIERAEFVAIMGPSGSGKSTLLHLLGGLDRPTSGEVVIDGQRLSTLGDDQLSLLRRRKIGFVFQFFNLFPILSAEENVMLPLLLDGQRPGNFGQRVTDLLGKMGIGARRQHQPHEMSGGEQQRVALARAMVAQPALILADEPTGNLDTHTGEEIMQLLRRACDDQQQTVVLVTHNPKDAAYADRIVFLKDGRVADGATLSQGTEPKKILARLNELQV